MRLGIAGYGFVGKALAEYFRSVHTIYVYDKFLSSNSDSKCLHALDSCDLVFVAVPTPTASNGRSCDLSAVLEIVAAVKAPMCLRSTVPPGTVEELIAKTGKQIAFSPEYIGESSCHPWISPDACGFLIVGGSAAMCELVFSAYRPLISPSFKFVSTATRTAELCKYMENCFLATKVAFVNQFFGIAEAMQVDFQELRNLWLLDSRIGESHTTVTLARGFRGRCLPKDLRALIAAMAPYGGAKLLEAVLEYNESITGDANRQCYCPTSPSCVPASESKAS